MYLYIHITLSRSSQAAAAVTNAVVTSASKGSGIHYAAVKSEEKSWRCTKEADLTDGSRDDNIQRGCREFPFWRTYFYLLLSLSLVFSISLFLSRSLLYASLRLSVLFLLRPFSTSEGTATLSSTTVKALVRGWGRTRENKLPSNFYYSFIGRSLHFAKKFLSSMNSLYCNVIRI